MSAFDLCVCHLKLCMIFQALQFLSKAHRCEVQAGGWEKEPALFKEVIKRAIDMGEGKNTTQLHRHPPSTQQRRKLCA